MPQTSRHYQAIPSPQLEVVSNTPFTDLRSNGGLFLPAEGSINDLNIPFTKYPGSDRIAGANVNFTMYVPDEILHRNPALFTLGYFAPECAYSDIAEVFARNGWVAFTHAPASPQQLLARFNRSHFGKPSRLSSQALWAVMRGGVRLAHELGVDIDEEFDISGHSRGGQTATNVALHRPDSVRSVILNEPAGMYDHNTLELSANIRPFIKKEMGDLPLGMVLRGARHMLSDIPRIACEGIDVSNCTIRERVQQLGELGIRTAAILGPDDTLISTEKIIELDQITHLEAFYEGPDGEVDHTWPQTNPVEAGFAQMQLLELLHQDASKDEPQQLTVAA